MLHDLKVHKRFWPALVDGRKNFEVRKNDRDFQTGDMLRLMYFDPDERDARSASAMIREVTYVLHSFEGLAAGYVALGLKDPAP